MDSRAVTRNNIERSYIFSFSPSCNSCTTVAQCHSCETIYWPYQISPILNTFNSVCMCIQLRFNFPGLYLPQTWWLKTTGTYSPLVLETRCPKSKCWQSHSPFSTPEGWTSLSLPASGSPRHFLVCVSTTTIHASVVIHFSLCVFTLFYLCACVFKFPPYKNTSHIELGVSSALVMTFSYLINLCQPYF